MKTSGRAGPTPPRLGNDLSLSCVVPSAGIVAAVASTSVYQEGTGRNLGGLLEGFAWVGCMM